MELLPSVFGEFCSALMLEDGRTVVVEAMSWMFECDRCGYESQLVGIFTPDRNYFLGGRFCGINNWYSG